MLKYLLAGLGVSLVLWLAFMKPWTWGGPPTPERLAELALTAPNVADREAAMVKLGEHKDRLDLIRKVYKESDTPQVRAAALQALIDNFDFDSMDIFVAGLRDESATIRGRAGPAMSKMLGRAFIYDPNAPPAEREKMAKEIEKDWKWWQGPGKAGWEDWKQRAKAKYGK